MPRREEQFSNGEIYHITTRAIDYNLIFKNTDDYYRGIFSIYEFNNTKPVSIKQRRIARKKFKMSIQNIQNAIRDAIRDRVSDGSSVDLAEEDKRDKLVEIFAFCFMPNHVHLLVKQLKVI